MNASKELRFWCHHVARLTTTKNTYEEARSKGKEATRRKGEQETHEELKRWVWRIEREVREEEKTPNDR